MSATLGALVIAISTEFSVLLSERFRQERRAGHELVVALRRTYRSTGRAVLASGITAIAGFGVLVLSDITMLRDFGFVTLIDLTVSLAGVLLVLPSVLAMAERRDVVDRAQELARRIAAGLPRRRPARVACAIPRQALLRATASIPTGRLVAGRRATSSTLTWPRRRPGSRRRRAGPTGPRRRSSTPGPTGWRSGCSRWCS
jgi:uncharacterized membrane protein YdfJ with MMPL/SSD domain